MFGHFVELFEPSASNSQIRTLDLREKAAEPNAHLLCGISR